MGDGRHDQPQAALWVSQKRAQRPESVGRLRVQEMDVEIIRNYEPDEEDLEEDDMDYDLKRIYPYVAL